MTTINGSNRSDQINQNNNAFLTINAFGGDDVIRLTRTDDLGGNNRVDAGKGNDQVSNLFEGGNQILLGKGNDFYIGAGFSFFNEGDIVDGGAGADQFVARTLLSTYLGGKGDDVFVSTGQKNNFDGGAGIDTISYQFRSEDPIVGNEGVTIALGEGGALTGSNSRENFTSIENAIGSANADIIDGSENSNVLQGLGGSDEIHGLGGDDTLTGGEGEDLLFGDGGADRFVFNTIGEISGNGDSIADFSLAEGDKIDVSGITFGNGNPLRFIGGGEFSNSAGEMRFEGGLILIDVNGDAIIDGVIALNVQELSTDDFIL